MNRGPMSILKISILKNDSIKPMSANDAINRTNPIIALVNLFFAASSDPLSPPESIQETAPHINWKKKNNAPATNKSPTPLGTNFSRNPSALPDS